MVIDGNLLFTLPAAFIPFILFIPLILFLINWDEMRFRYLLEYFIGSKPETRNFTAITEN